MKVYRGYLMVRRSSDGRVEVRLPDNQVVHETTNIRKAHHWIWRATKPKETKDVK